MTPAEQYQKEAEELYPIKWTGPEGLSPDEIFSIAIHDRKAFACRAAYIAARTKSDAERLALIEQIQFRRKENMDEANSLIPIDKEDDTARNHFTKLRAHQSSCEWFLSLLQSEPPKP